MSITHTCQTNPPQDNPEIQWSCGLNIENGLWILQLGEDFIGITYCPHCGEKLQPPQRINP